MNNGGPKRNVPAHSSPALVVCQREAGTDADSGKVFWQVWLSITQLIDPLVLAAVE